MLRRNDVNLFDPFRHGIAVRTLCENFYTVQEDAWAVISAFFDEKGLVRQQLDSFNEFIMSNMQEIVDEYGTFVVKPEAQHDPGAACASLKPLKLSMHFVPRALLIHRDATAALSLLHEATRTKHLSVGMPAREGSLHDRHVVDPSRCLCAIIRRRPIQVHCSSFVCRHASSGRKGVQD